MLGRGPEHLDYLGLIFLCVGNRLLVKDEARG
jgi:hypothetical protein